MRKMDALMQPPIIEKVFGFLRIFDVFQCQHVCRVWREVASSVLGRLLKKCPAIDECQSMFIEQVWAPAPTAILESVYEDSMRQLEEIITENHRMNMGGIIDGEDPLGRRIYFWYMCRGAFSDLLPMYKVDQSIQGFLTSDAECIPGFSFLQYNQEMESSPIRETTFDHPTVLIGMRSRDIENCHFQREMRPKIKFLDISHGEKFPKLSLCGSHHHIISYFEGFHINRYIPGVKIIITDWSDCKSARPDMNDPKFPVKSMLYFATSIDEYIAKIEKIEELLEKSAVKPIFSGGMLRQPKTLRDYSPGRKSFPYPEERLVGIPPTITPTISYVGPKSSKPKNSPIITIAFAGEGVKSVAYDIIYCPSFDILRLKLKEFKRTLDFPTDDGRVVGFILERLNPHHAPFSWFSSEAFHLIEFLFPDIKFSTIKIDKSYHHSAFDADITLCLIRV